MKRQPLQQDRQLQVSCERAEAVQLMRFRREPGARIEARVRLRQPLACQTFEQGQQTRPDRLDLDGRRVFDAQHDGASVPKDAYRTRFLKMVKRFASPCMRASGDRGDLAFRQSRSRRIRANQDPFDEQVGDGVARDFLAFAVFRTG